MSQANDLNMTVNDILANSLRAEQQGVSVDWKQTCMTVCNAASQYIAACEARVASLERVCAEAGLREAGND